MYRSDCVVMSESRVKMVMSRTVCEVAFDVNDEVVTAVVPETIKLSVYVVGLLSCRNMMV